MTLLEEREALAKRMGALDDDALIKMLAIEQADYREEAIQVAREELKRRHLRELSREEYLALPEVQSVRTTGFCSRCLAETTDESPGNTRTYMLFMGTRLVGLADPCPTCDSVIQRKFFCVIAPLVPLGRYRIKYLDVERAALPLFDVRYVGRRIRTAERKTRGQV
jgi:hypothetical protein